MLKTSAGRDREYLALLHLPPDFPHRFGPEDHFQVTFQDKDLRYEEFNDDPNNKGEGKAEDEAKDEAKDRSKEGSKGDTKDKSQSMLNPITMPWSSQPSRRKSGNPSLLKTLSLRRRLEPSPQIQSLY